MFPRRIMTGWIKAARLHLEKTGAKLTKQTKEQADYLGVKVEGPYKAEHYWY